MSLRKVAGLLAAFGLTLGLIGGGVGAVFHDQVTATENIDVGTFECKIIAATPGAASDGIAVDGKSLTFTAPTIMSSAAGSAPFSFTVQNTGSITQQLTVLSSWAGDLSSNFSSILATPTAPVTLVAGGTKTYDAGIQWAELGMADLGDAGSITYTVNCDEAPAAPVLPANTYVFASTNAQNIINGWANVVAVAGTGNVTLTFTQPRGFVACFEWRTDGDVPEQRLVADENSVGPPFAAHYLPGINDGLYKYACPGYSGYGTPGAANPNPTTVVVPVNHYVEVRLSFGGEADERFDWTRFDALP